MPSPFSDEKFFHTLLGKAVAGKASDVHIKVGQPPGARIRGDMIYFRTDRIIDMAPQDVRYPRRRAVLLKEWRDRQGIPADP